MSYLGWASLYFFNQSLFCAFKSEVEVAKGRLEVMHCPNLRVSGIKIRVL